MLSIYVIGKRYIVVNNSKNTEVFSGTLEECNNFKAQKNETVN